MALRSLSSFNPVDSKKKATELALYINSMDANERFSVQECLTQIKDLSIAKHFIDKCSKIGLLSMSEVLGFAKDLGLVDLITTIQGEVDNNKTTKKKKSKKSDIIKISKNDLSKRRKTLDKNTTNSLGNLYSILSIPSDYSNIIASNVKATELIVDDGVIIYGNYTLKSVRIKKTDPKYLCEISHDFSIKQDFSNGKKDRFVFYPYNDLSFLLAEIERIKTRNNIPSDEKFPLTGSFELPWRYVIFYDRIMYLQHPNSSKNSLIDPFNFRHPSILKSFRDILPYIQKVCSPFFVEAVDGAITKINNFEPFYKHIPHFYERVQLQEKEVEICDSHRVKPGSFLFLSEFKKQPIINKSKYIHYLSTKHVSNRPIFYLLESVSHESSDNTSDEKGYLFTIKEHNNISILVFENITDDSRSSLIFFVRTEFYDDAVTSIRRFLASDLPNKRQKLSYRAVKFPESIFKYERVIHNYFPYWTLYFQGLLSRNMAILNNKVWFVN